MTVKPRTLMIASVAVAATLSLAGCSAGGNSSADDEKAALTVWVDADRAKVLKDAAADFTTKTGVEVNLVQKDFGKLQEQFIAQVPTGKGPDITIGANDWTGNFVANGVVQPIELGDTAGDYQKVAIDAMTYQGKTYGLPYSIENIAILRNTALAPEPASSYADMASKGLLVQVGPQSDPYHLYPFQASFGAPVFGLDADGGYDPKKLELGGAKGAAFAAWLAEQGKAGVLSTSVTGDIAKQKFLAGSAPFLLTGPWNVADAQKAGIELAVDPIPSPGGGEATPFVGVQGFFISAKAKNTLAANDFLTNYLGTEEVQTELYKAGARPPALTAAFEKASSDPIIKGFGAVGSTGQPLPSIPAMAKVWQFWGVTQASIIDGKGDPATLWSKMTTDIQTAIEK